MKDYYRKPYMFNDYSDMMDSNSNETVRDAIAHIRKFEFLKPYRADSDDEVETDYSRIVNEYTLPSNQVLTLFMLEDEGNFTLDYKRYHPPNKSHMCPEIPDPWGEAFMMNLHGYTYKTPNAQAEGDENTTTTKKPDPKYPVIGGTDQGYLHWKVRPQSEVTLDTRYLLEVFNGFKRSYQTRNGIVIKDRTQYKQPFFSLTKGSSSAKGVKLLQRFRFYTTGNYTWYDVTSKEFQSIRYSISKNQITNLMQGITVAELIVSADAQGRYLIKVSDGTTTLTARITIKDGNIGFYFMGYAEGQTPKYFKLEESYQLTDEVSDTAYDFSDVPRYGLRISGSYSVETVYSVSGPYVVGTRGGITLCGSTEGHAPYYWFWFTYWGWDLASVTTTTWSYQILSPSGDSLDNISGNDVTNGEYNNPVYTSMGMVCAIEYQSTPPDKTYTKPDDTLLEGILGGSIEGIYISPTRWAHSGAMSVEGYQGDEFLTAVMTESKGDYHLFAGMGKYYLRDDTNNKSYFIDGDNDYETIRLETIMVEDITYTIDYTVAYYKGA